MRQKMDETQRKVIKQNILRCTKLIRELIQQGYAKIMEAGTKGDAVALLI